MNQGSDNLDNGRTDTTSHELCSICPTKKVILNLSRPHREVPAVKFYSIGASALDEALMSQPDPFVQPQCRLIKSERKIKVGFIPMRIRGRTKTVYIKQHNALSTGHRLSSLFLSSAALRSLKGAVILLQGYTPQPNLSRLWSTGTGVCCVKALYFSEEVPGAKTVDAFWREDLKIYFAAQKVTAKDGLFCGGWRTCSVRCIKGEFTTTTSMLRIF